ncbi:hypothetical protein BO70DRAFT_347131 [Aspergillus heteromorphus CBS 117.55]|uniref:Uncharacterized protein n=1 Tax=Aspergillus heteromorphus CBS 117.55 TaxID=1448321 RepID=A0A317URA4_9EURO|nr:uncharacterized protein BO70DRAFT_347131 [Aspergillus heteromorphus CBS 117.55]PWY64251.1 hypothetical protein BO70DRAFT_347131 [Aspergillus heteromorphus CBS 117.55]
MYRGCNGFRSSPGQLRDHFKVLKTLVFHWAGQFGREDLTALSPDQKRAIITSLDGQCVQEDWDHLYARLPTGAQLFTGHVLGESMIFKHIFARLIDRPFWSLDARSDAADQGGDADFYKRLEYLYERFYIGSPRDAAWWKSHTVALCNLSRYSCMNLRANELGNATHKHNAALVDALTDELLGREVFQLVLEGVTDPDVERARRSSLSHIMQLAAKASLMALGGMNANLRVDRLPELSTFNPASGAVKPHVHHFSFTPDAPLTAPVKGGQVLLLVSPGLCITDTPARGMGPSVPEQVLRAEVFTEHRETDSTSDQESDSEYEDKDMARSEIEHGILARDGEWQVKSGSVLL